MSKADDYRENAARSVELARRVGNSSVKRRLLALAEAWLDLADHAHRLARKEPPTGEHPLVRKKLGPSHVRPG
jgi:uncharacterized protein YutE (UPF0331/DUF86 family)